MSRSPLQRLECAVVLAVKQLRIVVHLAEHWVLAVRHLAVEHVNGGKDAFLSNRHGFVVDAYADLLDIVEIALAHVIALHQVRLHRWDVVQLFKFHSVIDSWLEQWIALGVLHIEVSGRDVCA